MASACVAPKQVRPPAQPSVPVRAPVIPSSPPASSDWRDFPLTPGDWTYGSVPGGSAARFGRSSEAPDLVVRCDRATRTVSLERSAAAAPGTAAVMAITTSAGNRALSATSVAQASPPASIASLPARDGFLDKMAFSRGRFIVSVTGTARLVLPSWPEFARVVEDCRD